MEEECGDLEETHLDEGKVRCLYTRSLAVPPVSYRPKNARSCHESGAWSKGTDAPSMHDVARGSLREQRSSRT